MQPVDEEGLKRLAEYWFRAHTMHHCFRSLFNGYNEDVSAIRKAGRIWELFMYMD
jgi:hypothetical protein